MAKDVVVGQRVGDPGVRASRGGADADAAPAAWVAGVRARLAGMDVGALGDRERVELIAELERVKGAASAAQARATHALRTSREVTAPQDAVRSVGSQVALARRESPAMGDRFVGLSRALVTELPHTMAALSGGVIGERHAIEVAQQSATLSVQDRAELDARMAPLLGRLGVAGVGRAARRIAAQLDAAAVVARMEAAARSRRVSVRPAPDGMAYLTVLGPMPEVVGAFAALRARATAVVGGQCPEEGPGGRGAGAVMADTATRMLSGRTVGQMQPVEVHLVMTDRALFGTGDPARPVDEPARIPWHGPVPAPAARAWLREAAPEGEPRRGARPHGGGAAAADSPTAGRSAGVWLRRLYTSPDGRDLVAMDSRRRVFTGLLRRMLVLRDDVCTTPWCQAPIAHADHVVPARDGGPTTFTAGAGKCARCNYVKEAPGWAATVIHRGLDPGDTPAGAEGAGSFEVEVTTPTGHRYRSTAPPLTGWGWQPASTLEQHLHQLLDAA